MMLVYTREMSTESTSETSLLDCVAGRIKYCRDRTKESDTRHACSEW